MLQAGRQFRYNDGMPDRFSPVLGETRGSGQPRRPPEPGVGAKVAQFIDRANAHGPADSAREEVIDGLSRMAAEHELQLDDGYFLVEVGEAEPHGELRGIYDEVSGALLGMVLLLYGEVFRTNPAITFARFLPLQT